MFVKLFKSIYDGSLRGKPDCLLVFIYLLANADAEGVVDIHPSKIADDNGLPISRVKEALLKLESADEDSRTPDHEGKRIARLDDHRNWGWCIVNYIKYRQIRDVEDRKESSRIASKNYRDRIKGKNKSTVSVIKSDDASSTVIDRHWSSTESSKEEEEEELHTLNSPLKDLEITEISDSEDLEPMSEENFVGPRKMKIPDAMGNPIADYPEDVQSHARQFWAMFAMEHHGSALRNLHLDSTRKEIRHFAAAISAFGQTAIDRLSEYYTDPPAEDKQLAAFQVIIKLGLQKTTEDLTKTARERTRAKKAADIITRKPINF